MSGRTRRRGVEHYPPPLSLRILCDISRASVANLSHAALNGNYHNRS